jgi:hypothetical protein
MGSGGFDDATVSTDGGVDEQGLWMLVGEEVVEGRVEEAGVQLKLLFVFGAEGGIGVDDADQLGVVLLGELLQKSDDVAVLEADDGDADGLLLGRERGGDQSEECGNENRVLREP